MEGKLVIFSAPSGTGKTTIVKQILKRIKNLEFSISACTRSPRQGEVDGKDYYFLSTEEFKKNINDDGFIEWEEVYKNQYYGTLKSEIHRIWEKKNHVIFDIDVKGGINLKKQFQEKAISIFITPPSIDELEKRLRSRNTDDEESIQKRLDKAAYELTFADQFDVNIVNDNLDAAIEETFTTLKYFLNI